MILNNKVAIIAGGMTGVGRRIAERFREEGAIVYVIDMFFDKLENIKIFPADLRQKDTVKEIVEWITSGKDERIDILVNIIDDSIDGKNIEADVDVDVDVDKFYYKLGIDTEWNIVHEVFQKMQVNRCGHIITILNQGDIYSNDVCGIACFVAKGSAHSRKKDTIIEFSNSGVICNVIKPICINAPFLDAFISMDGSNRIYKCLGFKQKGTIQKTNIGSSSEIENITMSLASEKFIHKVDNMPITKQHDAILIKSSST